jgi:hypothetical protein
LTQKSLLSVGGTFVCTREGFRDHRSEWKPPNETLKIESQDAELLNATEPLEKHIAALEVNLATSKAEKVCPPITHPELPIPNPKTP